MEYLEHLKNEILSKIDFLESFKGRFPEDRVCVECEQNALRKCVETLDEEIAKIEVMGV